MQRYNILWADDEIDLLKPHIIFLNQRGYDIEPVNNGMEAVELCNSRAFDVVFLDENMPGMSGLEALTEIKNNKPAMPVVMITKNEAEKIMEEAIGSKIDDYLIKPLNPNQILLSLKKLLENKRLIIEKNNHNYQQEFRKISLAFMENMTHQEWAQTYRKLVYWELQLGHAENADMAEVLQTQKTEANTNFCQYVKKNYEDWLNNPNADRPVLSHQLLRKKVFTELKPDVPVFFILIDNMRWDQWRVIEPLVSELFDVEQEDTYYAILPTVTAYARNAIFAGMLPSEIARIYPDLWVGEDEDESKNNYEEDLLGRQIKKYNLNTKFSYHKILRQEQGHNLAASIPNLFSNGFNAIVYNFVDMLSHARTDVEMVRELAPDEAAYRSLTKSWFEHSPLYEILQRISERKAKVIITTDHGTIQVKRPFKIIGDRNVNTNLRYKQGKNLSFEGDGKVMVVTRPERIFLPKTNVTTTYVFATGDQFFAYPNNYNHYVNYFRDTFQHGGISLEEMIIPLISLSSKNE